MAVTIKDIANEAGVSKSAVSKVLNGRSDVSSDTRELVQGVIEKLGYVPSSRARNLSLGINKDIAVVLPSDNYVYMRFFFSIYRYSYLHGYNVSLYITNHDRQEEIRIFKNIKSDSLGGLVYFVDPDGSSTTSFYLNNLNFPVVVVGEGTGYENFDRVFCSEREMADALVAMLLKSGAEKAICLFMPDVKEYQKKRNFYVKSALLHSGIHPDNVSSFYAPEVSSEEGYKAMMGILKEDPGVAVCSLSNVFTSGILRALADNHILADGYPLYTLGDMSIFSESGFSQSYVTYPIEKLAGETIEVLHSKIEKKDDGNLIINVDPFCCD